MLATRKKPPMSKSELQGHHRVVGLKEAILTSENPWKREPKLKGCAAKGKTYERTIIRRLEALIPNLLHASEWIRYQDASCEGTRWRFAQPDAYILCDRWIWLLEVKRTQTSLAGSQMRYLYEPLLKKLYPGLPIIKVQVCKNLRTVPENEITRLREATSPDVIYTYHCVGEVFNI